MTDEPDYKKMFETLDKRHHALSGTLERCQKELDVMKGLHSILVREKAQWETQKGVQNNIIKQALGQSDKTVERLQDEIMDIHDEKRKLKFENKKLKAENKRLKNDNND